LVPPLCDLAPLRVSSQHAEETSRLFPVFIQVTGRERMFASLGRDGETFLDCEELDHETGRPKIF
jgi:hypothetical protein